MWYSEKRYFVAEHLNRALDWMPSLPRPPSSFYYLWFLILSSTFCSAYSRWTFGTEHCCDDLFCLFRHPPRPNENRFVSLCLLKFKYIIEIIRDLMLKNHCLRNSPIKMYYVIFLKSHPQISGLAKFEEKRTFFACRRGFKVKKLLKRLNHLNFLNAFKTYQGFWLQILIELFII